MSKTTTKTAPTARQSAESLKPVVQQHGKPGFTTTMISGAIFAALKESTPDRAGQNAIMRELHENVIALPRELADDIRAQLDAHHAQLAKEAKEREDWGPFVATITDPYFQKRAKEQNKKSRIAACVCLNGGDFTYKRNTWISVNVCRQLMALDDDQKAALLDACSKAEQATVAFDQAHNL